MALWKPFGLRQTALGIDRPFGGGPEENWRGRSLTNHDNVLFGTPLVAEMRTSTCRSRSAT